MNAKLSNLEYSYKLFGIPIAPVTWKILLDRANDDIYVDPVKKEKYIEAVSFLKAEMGKGFFKNCGVDHPVRQKLINLPTLLDNLLHFANTLKSLKYCESNYPCLVSKLRPLLPCRDEGRYFMDIACEYQLKNFQVEFLSENPPHKMPDIKITDKISLESFFIEVNRVDDSEDRMLADNEHRILSDVILNHGFDLPVSFKQLKHINKNELANVVNKLKSIKDEAFNNRCLVIFQNEFIDIAISHPSKTEEFNEWCRQNNRQSAISGLSIDFNDTRRILQQSRIAKKVKQIPTEGSGLIYMPIHFLYFRSMDIPQTIMLLIEEIQNYPNLLGLVLYADLGQPIPEEEVLIMNHAVTIKSRNGILRHTIYVQNDAFKGNLGAATIQRIRTCII
jgi:hypothetical protein